ncbi:uncharacterized protein IUM83_14772 [Phytophthora cinnamomi]|uniref:uncharacterized protein n=1 Tax=Phytophthora cinnamomi TaxID=4785 RepID=UPI00355A40FB|nr:hypothetical protein IUM83_14772 [Phytophthora cinnamomi]
MEPGTITCDFEQGLINAVGDQFPNSTVMGCLFHFKQAVRKRMVKLHIPTAEISVAMARGMLDVVTILPREQMDPQGIEYVTNRIKSELQNRNSDYSEDKWNEFWQYFRRTWIELYPPTLWNVRGINRQIINRTNNPLERYNRELNNEFATRRPNVQTFVSVIELHAHHYVTLLEDIARGRAHTPPHGAYYTPPEFSL